MSDQEVEETLRAFYRAHVRIGDVHEVRIPNPVDRWQRVVAGYVDHEDAFVAAVLPYAERHLAEAVYVTLNPVDRALLSRAANRLKANAKATATDKDVVRRRHLLIDVDPRRPSDISATEEERTAAVTTARAIESFLGENGWPAPVVAGSSGNGGMLVYRIDLPNDDVCDTLVAGVLRGVAAAFSDGIVAVDTSVGNAARLVKIVGTVAAKGDFTHDRPWRRAEAEIDPDAGTVAREHLEFAAALGGDPASGGTANGNERTSGKPPFDIRAILRERGIGFTEKPKDYGAVLELDRCLTSTEHEDGACIIVFPSGAHGYRCHHASCAGKGWRDARAALGLGEPDDSAHAAHSQDAGPWTMPTPLDAHPRPEFPIDVLPDWLGRYVAALAVATQTPPALGGMLGLAVLAAACAGKLELVARTGWREPLNLFVVVALPPGERKSAVLAAVTQPLEAFERDERARAGPLIAAAAARKKIAEQALAKKQAEAAKAGDPVDRATLSAEAEARAREAAAIRVPTPPRLVADDCTPERLASLLAEQDGRMAVLSAEGGPFELMSGRYAANGAPNLEVFLKGHAGDALRVDRVNRPPEFVASPALTLGLAVQPEVIRGLAAKPGFRGKGLLARFLYAVPDSRVGHRSVAPPPVPADIEREYVSGITALLRLGSSADHQGEAASRTLRFSPEADAALARFEAELEPRLAETADLGHLRDWAGKLAGAVARIAGLLHLAEYRAHPAPWAVPVAEGSVAAAVRLARAFLVPHALAAFGQMGADPAVADAQHALRHVAAKGWETFTKRDLFEATKGRVKTVDALDPALGVLLAHGYVRRRAEGTRPGPGRRASPTFDVNPLWRAQNAQNSQNAGASAGDPDPGTYDTGEPTSSANQANTANGNRMTTVT